MVCRLFPIRPLPGIRRSRFQCVQRDLAGNRKLVLKYAEDIATNRQDDPNGRRKTNNLLDSSLFLIFIGRLLNFTFPINF